MSAKRKPKMVQRVWYPLSRFHATKFIPFIVFGGDEKKKKRSRVATHTEHTSLLPETYISILVCCLSFAWAKRMCLVQFQPCTIFNSLSDVRVVCVPFPCSLPYVMYYSVYAYTSDSFVIFFCFGFCFIFSSHWKTVLFFALFFLSSKTTKNRLMIVLNHIYPFRNGNPQNAATLDKLHKFLHIFNVDVIGTKTMQCMVHTHDRISCDCFSCLLYFFFYCTIFFCRLVLVIALYPLTHIVCVILFCFFSIFSFSYYLTTVFYLSFMSFIVKYVIKTKVKYVFTYILAINNARDPPRSK